MKARLSAGGTLAVLLAVVSSAHAADEDTVADTVIGNKNHTILATALKETGLAEQLKGKGPYTLFAPTDAAFKKLGDEKVQELIGNKELLKATVLNHVVEGKVALADAAKRDGTEIKTLGGTTFKASAPEGKWKIGQATAIPPEMKCSNGVVHAIDTVLIPGGN
ncbi:MAG TPA: fasciclin domain-containing protein [Gemmataceae bacterium]|nr:fasciclin domain-containing protein [Gemmataceae bacterium]